MAMALYGYVVRWRGETADWLTFSSHSEEPSLDTTRGILATPPANAFAYRSLRSILDAASISALQKAAQQADSGSWSQGMRKGYALQLEKLFHDASPAIEYVVDGERVKNGR